MKAKGIALAALVSQMRWAAYVVLSTGIVFPALGRFFCCCLFCYLKV